MTSKENVTEFLSQKSIAIAGVSRNGKKIGNSVLKELKNKGYTTFAVNPNADEIEGEKCFRRISMINEKVNAAVVAVPKNESANVVRNAVEAGVKNIWLQQGTETDEAINFCVENKVNLIYGECILMFAEPTAFFHKAHRWVNGLLGKLPK